ncbi:MAG TPA: hypothetical protein VJ437_06795 [Acidiferrobacterales bacterium]|nr:hypothetical protein [Acidiferrobacterales bacterium]
MAVWIVPALKAILPHIGTIVSAAVPVFTKKHADAAANQAILQQQITELQSAASQNASHIKELAAQLQSTVAALEQAAAVAETRLRRVSLVCIAASILSVIAFGVASYLIW